jgi:hypothetical protein
MQANMRIVVSMLGGLGGLQFHSVQVTSPEDDRKGKCQDFHYV